MPTKLGEPAHMQIIFSAGSRRRAAVEYEIAGPGIAGLPSTLQGGHRMQTSVAFLLCCSVAAPVPAVDPFDLKLDDLQRQDWSLARHVRITAWERFIAKNPKHPRVAVAMIALGHLHANQDLNREPPEKADEAGSVAWFRRAVRASKRGSDLWVEAQFLVAVRVVFGNPAEARSIYRAIKAERTDSLTLARVEHHLATVCVVEGDRAGALRPMPRS